MRGRHKAEEEKLIKEAKMMAQRDGIEAVAGEEPGVSAWLGAMKQLYRDMEDQARGRRRPVGRYRSDAVGRNYEGIRDRSGIKHGRKAFVEQRLGA